MRWPARVPAFDLHPPEKLPYNPGDYSLNPYNPEKFPIEPYTPKILICPSDDDPPMEYHSYVLNQHLSDKAVRITTRDMGGKKSGEIVVMGEKKSIERDYYMETDEFDRIVDKYRHGVERGSNYLFHDGHVDVLEPKIAIASLDPWIILLGAHVQADALSKRAEPKDRP